jgi:uncharacterized protein (DUF1778 family)
LLAADNVSGITEISLEGYMMKKKKEGAKGAALHPFVCRPTKDEHRELRIAAATAGEQLSKFVVRVALEAARTILKNPRA